MKKEKEVNVAEEEKEVIDDGFFEEIDEEAEKEAKKAKKKGNKKKKIAIIAGTVLGCVTAGLIGVSVYKSTQKKKAAGLNVIDGSGSTESEDKIEEQKSDIPENLSDDTTDSLMNAARML